jgi:FkbM family methyltransferase
MINRTQKGQMLLKEYIAHHLINTPFEEIAHKLRDLTQLQKQIKHPELRGIYVESSRIKTAMARIIHDSMNCIDIGAHLGSVLSVIKQRSPHGKHIAIEPIPYKSAWLKQKFLDVEVLQIALSDTVGEVDFFLQTRRSGFSGLRLQGSGARVEEVKILKVNCNKLDNIIPSDRPIGFIKVDVEGGELAVLRGSESILKRDRPTVIFECTKGGLKAHDYSPCDLYDFFKTHSYSIFLVEDWLCNGEALSYERFVKAMQYPYQAFNFLAVPKKV